MSDREVDPVREGLEDWVGKPLGGVAGAPDEVNVAMIRHWVDAFDDRNPVYLDEDVAAKSRFGGIVAPPTMLQVWTMPRPKIEGIAERGGVPDDMLFENPISILDDAGYTATLATNSELDFDRYLKPREKLESSIVVESISARKKTSLGLGYFVTWVTTYTSDGEVVGRQLFRVFKFDPSTIDPATFGGAS